MDTCSPSESAPLKPRDRIVLVCDYVFPFSICTLHFVFGVDLDRDRSFESSLVLCFCSSCKHYVLVLLSFSPPCKQ